MKTLIEIHALQNFVPSNLNRDDTGAPKDALFGGTRRARVSSQCLKRAVRQYFDQKKEGGLFRPEELADRTKRLLAELRDKLADKGRRGPDADKKIEMALASMGLKLKGEKTEYLLFLGKSEVSRLADKIHEKWDEIGDPAARASAIKSQLDEGLPKGNSTAEKMNAVLQVLKLTDDKQKIKEEEIVAIENNLDEIVKVLVKHYEEIQPVQATTSASGKGKGRKKSEMPEWEKDIQEILKEGRKGISPLGKALLTILDGGKAVDLALFGRMLADMPEKNQHAACQVAHAISTHAVEREFDFYTAVDDLKPEDTAGADMMGTVEFNSACFYHYAVIDWEKLVKNLQDDKELAAKGLQAFLEGFVIAEPTGKQNTFAAHHPQEFIAISVRRNTAPRNLANAFEIAIRVKRDESLTEVSASKLVEKSKKLADAFDGKGQTFVLNLTDADINGFGTKVDSLADLLKKSLDAVKE
ncbi:MAG: type I-E CRISPR-associated protein Cas7/Cse4/CasC [Syntrophales bacterium]